ncbi:MAG TPA: response regulator transcription factor [Anaerolineales bacterium]|nr:response regulator transcription factor [Anaerolineales bacterium]
MFNHLAAGSLASGSDRQDMEKVSIVVVDDHPLFRQGVVNTLSLEPGFLVVGQAENGHDAISIIRKLHPHIAIVDVNLPGVNGQQVTHQVVQEKLPTRVVLLTAYNDKEQIIHAAWAGAAAYCSKDVDPSQLVQAIKEVVSGKYVIEGRVFNQQEFELWLEEEMERARHLYSDPGSPFHPLSNREMEVLTCVVRGLSNKEIAASLGISHQTVKNHVTSILRKFGVEDRTQAVVYALKRGWVKLLDKQTQSQE